MSSSRTLVARMNGISWFACMQEFERLHPCPTRHGVIAHDHVIGLRAQSFCELRRDLNPIRGDCKIHPFEFMQAAVDVGFPVINEENSYRPPPVGRDATGSNSLMIPMSFVLDWVCHGKPLSRPPGAGSGFPDRLTEHLKTSPSQRVSLGENRGHCSIMNSQRFVPKQYTFGRWHQAYAPSWAIGVWRHKQNVVVANANS